MNPLMMTIAGLALMAATANAYAQQQSPGKAPPAAAESGAKADSPPAAATQNKPETKSVTKSETKSGPKTGPTPSATAAAQPHVFAIMAGAWSGGGTIALSSGTRERLRCRARHHAGQGGKSLSLNIRCASDSYRFDLSSNVVERRGRIFGRWSEASNGVSGSVSGSAAGNRVRAVATSDMFTAGLALTTQGNRQTVSITPRGVHITGVHISLRKN